MDTFGIYFSKSNILFSNTDMWTWSKAIFSATSMAFESVCVCARCDIQNGYKIHAKNPLHHQWNGQAHSANGNIHEITLRWDHWRLKMWTNMNEHTQVGCSFVYERDPDLSQTEWKLCIKSLAIILAIMTLSSSTHVANFFKFETQNRTKLVLLFWHKFAKCCVTNKFMQRMLDMFVLEKISEWLKCEWRIE